MKFSSIKEFFYKLQSMCYALSLIPLGVMIARYTVPQLADMPAITEDPQIILILQIILPVFALIELTIVHLVIRTKLNQIISLPSLGDRLDRYVPLAYVRTVSAIILSMVMLAALFITGHILFAGYAVGMLIIVFLQRSSPKIVVKQLQLKGNERELILKGELK